VTEPYPDALRAEHQRALLPLAAVAPAALPWTGATSAAALAAYEVILAVAWLRARRGRPLSVSNAALNVLALVYVAWFFLAARALHSGLVRTASNLLLFTAAAKFVSMKNRREENLTLLLCFFLALDSASTSTHVLSLAFLGVLAVVGFRTLARIAVLADFDRAPPEAALGRVPTWGIASASVLATSIVAVPLFMAFPRLQSPFAVAPIPKQAVDGSFFTSDRVDLETFSSTKRSDRILLRVQTPEGDLPDPLRLREATFNRYLHGHWIREGMISSRLREGAGGRIDIPREYTTAVPARTSRAGRTMSVETSSFTPGFLFVPYGTHAVTAAGTPLSIASDATIAYSGPPSDRRYTAEYVAQADGAGPGRTSVPLHDVPPEVAALSRRITAGAATSEEKSARLLAYLARGFTYRIDVPEAVGDPVVDFLTRTRAGHCEYFASALALMLRASGVPARLATGSLGGEVGPLTSEILVRGDNLHAWVEASLDGESFRVLDPTPPEGRPRIVSVSLWRRIAELGNEIEFFYDRNILGFSTLEQVQLVEAARDIAARLDRAGTGIGAAVRASRRFAAAAAILLLAAAGMAAWARRRRRVSPATHAYLRLRRIHEKRIGRLPASAPSGAVIRGFAASGRDAGVAARRVVEIYRAEAFGGSPADGDAVRELRRLVRLLRKAAAAAVLVVAFLAAPRKLSAAPLAGSDGGAPPPAARAPDAAPDARRQDLARLQARVEDSRRRLADAEKKTATLEQEVEALDLRLEVAQRQREWIAARRDDVARRTAAITADLETARGSRTRSEEAFRARIRLLSRLGRFGYLRLLLAARGTSDVFAAMRTLDAMARADARDLARFTEAGRRLEADLRAQNDLRRETEQLLSEDRGEERRIAAGKSERLRLLARSKTETVATRREVTELSQKAEKLESLLDLLARGESTTTGSPRPWRGVLDWPVHGAIAVTFGRHRHPKFDAWTVSNGIEIAAPDGTGVSTIYGGKVVFARWFPDYGNMAVIDHGDEVLTLYARLRSILVRVGDVVATGDRIGLVGIGPGETEPSLYFEVRDHQKATDPVSWLR